MTGFRPRIRPLDTENPFLLTQNLAEKLLASKVTLVSMYCLFYAPEEGEMSGRPGLTLLGRHTTMQPPENEKKRLLIRILWQAR
jgi:hypothetical protein